VPIDYLQIICLTNLSIFSFFQFIYPSLLSHSFAPLFYSSSTQLIMIASISEFIPLNNSYFHTSRLTTSLPFSLIPTLKGYDDGDLVFS
jgi:hypothetical protein